MPILILQVGINSQPHASTRNLLFSIDMKVDLVNKDATIHRKFLFG